MGGVIGPFKATCVRRMEATTVSGRGVPYFSRASTPASTSSHSMGAPVAGITFLTTPQSSGPVPSPRINVTFGIAFPQPRDKKNAKAHLSFSDLNVLYYRMLPVRASIPPPALAYRPRNHLSLFYCHDT